MLFQAHRGVSTEYPENTIPAFAAAAQQGYQLIELDPTYTADGECVVFHDHTINRTCRNEDGSEIPDEIKTGELSYQQLLTYDAGVFMGQQFRGTRVPLLQEVLALAAKEKLEVKIDNRFESFTDWQQEKLFNIVEASGANAGFTCMKMDTIRRIVKRFPNAPIHYDGAVDQETVKEIRAALKNNALTVWAPLPSKLTSWVTVPFATPELCAMIKKYARLGIWILEDMPQLEQAAALGADVIETTGSIKPM